MSYSTKSNIIPNSPRSEAVALFQLETGHDCQPAYLHRINLLDSPHYVRCGCYSNITKELFNIHVSVYARVTHMRTNDTGIKL